MSLSLNIVRKETTMALVGAERDTRAFGAICGGTKFTANNRVQ